MCSEGQTGVRHLRLPQKTYKTYITHTTKTKKISLCRQEHRTRRWQPVTILTLPYPCLLVSLNHIWQQQQCRGARMQSQNRQRRAMCYVKVGEAGETPGYARPPSSVIPVGPTDKRVLELGRGRTASSTRITHSSNLYNMSRQRSAVCLLM